MSCWHACCSCDAAVRPATAWHIMLTGANPKGIVVHICRRVTGLQFCTPFCCFVVCLYCLVMFVSPLYEFKSALGGSRHPWECHCLHLQIALHMKDHPASHYFWLSVFWWFLFLRLGFSSRHSPHWFGLRVFHWLPWELNYYQTYDRTMGGMYLRIFVQFHDILCSVDSSALLYIQAQLHTLLPGCKLHCQSLQPNCTHVCVQPNCPSVLQALWDGYGSLNRAGTWLICVVCNVQYSAVCCETSLSYQWLRRSVYVHVVVFL